MNTQEISQRLERIESLLLSMQDAPTRREFYTTAEAAELLDRAEFTVREWCRRGRIAAVKSHTGRGNSTEWRISYEEIERYRNEGLLPDARRFDAIAKAMEMGGG